MGELDPGVGAAAVPIFNGEDEVVGALALVGTVQRLREIGNSQLRAWLDAGRFDDQHVILTDRVRVIGCDRGFVDRLDAASDWRNENG